MATMTWRLSPAPGGGWQGEIHFPDGFLCAGRAPTKAAAMTKAASLAEKVLNNPVLSAALPPQAQLALRGAKLLAKYGTAGGLTTVLTSKAAKKGLSALKKALF